MRVLSWIFQPVYLIFFAILAALYIYRSEVIPEHRDAEESRVLATRMEQVTHSIEDEYRAVNKFAIDKRQKGDIGHVLEQDVIPLVKSETEPTEMVSEKVKIEPQPEFIPDPVVQLSPGAGEHATIVEVDAALPMVETAQSEIPLSDIPSESLGELWYAARKSAMDGNIEQAIASYIRLTSGYPQHANGFGELGNLYYTQGNLEQAIEAYQQALSIYKRRGGAGESIQLQNIINRLSNKNN
ncbi:MAG: tetratricopeptide repeat protein [Chromatiales bacterium]|nr:tetratricopeptide repeat protein [Chromatiales bacterium]